MTIAPQFILRTDQPYVDGAGRLRTSQLTTLGNYVMDVDHEYLISKVESGATLTRDSSNNSMDFALNGAASGEYAALKSRHGHTYLAGRTQYAEFTFENLTPVTNGINRIGYYTSSTSAPYTADLDGFWLEAEGSDVKLVIARRGSTTEIPSASWDNQDAVGNIDWSTFTVIQADFLHLGGTYLRLWHVQGKGKVLLHVHEHANSHSGTIFGTPCLPIRAESRSTASGASTSLKFYCAEVATEGDIGSVGVDRYQSDGNNSINANSVGTWYLLKAYRLKADFLGHQIVPVAATAQATTNDDFEIGIFFNPTINNFGSPAWSDIPDIGAQHAAGASGNPSNTTLTAGQTPYWGTMVERNLTAAAISVQASEEQMGWDFGTGRTIIALCARPFGANLDVRGALSLRELT